MQCPDPALDRASGEGEWAASRTNPRSRGRPNLKAEDIAKLSDVDIGRYFTGSFGAAKRREATALLRFLASARINTPPEPKRVA